MNPTSDKLLTFGDLNDDEKEKYFQFLVQNNIEFIDTGDNDQFVAKVKIKTPSRLPRNKIPNKENLPVPKDRSISSRRVSPKKVTPSPSITKSVHKKDPFVLASARSHSSNRGSEMSYRYESQEKSIENKDLNTLIENVELKKPEFTDSAMNSVNTESSRHRSSNTHLDRSRSSNFDSVSPNRLMARRATVDDVLKETSEYFREFIITGGLQEAVTKVKPKKMQADQITRTIEEIFSLRFIRETTILKATISKNAEPGVIETLHNTFNGFVIENLKEKAKSKFLYEQNAISLIYNLFTNRKKSNEIELFSSFLAQEYDNEDLTFFLFGRSICEKELNLMFLTRASAAVGTMISQKTCLKVIESIYGKGEKVLVMRLFKKVKEHLENEKEKKIDQNQGKINLYAFLKLALEDYHISRKEFLEQESSKHHRSGSQTNMTIPESRELSEISTPEKERDEPLHDAPMALSDITGNFENVSKAKYLTEQKEFLEDHLYQSEKFSVPSLKGKINNIDSQQPEKQNADNFSFRNYEIEKNINVGNHSELNSKRNSESYSHAPHSLYPPVPSIASSSKSLQNFQNFNSQASLAKFVSEKRSMENLQPLMDKCLSFMMGKVEEFIHAMIFEGKDSLNHQEHLLKIQLMELLERKLKSLAKALFSFDKVKWLNALMIESPTQRQLQNIEDLQKELRSLNKKKMEEVDDESVMKLSNMIFRTPELSSQIGKLIVEFTLPHDLQEEESL